MRLQVIGLSPNPRDAPAGNCKVHVQSVLTFAAASARVRAVPSRVTLVPSPTALESLSDGTHAVWVALHADVNYLAAEGRVSVRYTTCSVRHLMRWIGRVECTGRRLRPRRCNQSAAMPERRCQCLRPAPEQAVTVQCASLAVGLARAYRPREAEARSASSSTLSFLSTGAWRSARPELRAGAWKGY